jgi:hypothetical protein
MIVNNSDIERIAVDPAEDDAPLLVDTDAVDPLQIAAQSFEVVTRWYAQVVQVRGSVDELQDAKENAVGDGLSLPEGRCCRRSRRA